MAPLVTLGLVVVAGCAHGGAEIAQEIHPSKEGYSVKNDQIALELTNENFEDAFVTIDLPEGTSVRLGWVPGQHTKAWAVPMQESGQVIFHIQLQKATGGVALGTDNSAQSVRGVARCESQLYFDPGTAKSLYITEEGGGGNFCPGSSVTGPA